jgi:hypothetical protein
MWLVYNMVRGMREHHGRAFRRARDLYVRPSGRAASAEWSLLPDDVGLDAQGQGRTWSNTHLLDRGREAARGAGIGNPTSAAAIRFGLLEAAKLNPLVVEPVQVASLVRMALFQADPDKPSPGRSSVERVTERLLRAVLRHLDESADCFNGWFSGPKSGLLSSLCSMRDEHDWELHRDEIRQALLQLGWEAYQYVAGCVHAAMRYFENAIDLTDDERRLFEHTFLPQPYFGGLPLVLLAERAEFLQEAILHIRDTPDDPANVSVLHRLLHYYAQIAERRREADRRFKAKAGKRIGGRLPQNIESDVEPRAVPTAPQSQCSSVGELVRELNDIECDCACPECKTFLELFDGDEGGTMRFSFCCLGCGKDLGEVEISPDRLRELAQQLDAPRVEPVEPDETAYCAVTWRCKRRR